MNIVIIIIIIMIIHTIEFVGMPAGGVRRVRPAGGPQVPPPAAGGQEGLSSRDFPGLPPRTSSGGRLVASATPLSHDRRAEQVLAASSRIVAASTRPPHALRRTERPTS